MSLDDAPNHIRGIVRDCSNEYIGILSTECADDFERLHTQCRMNRKELQIHGHTFLIPRYLCYESQAEHIWERIAHR